MKSQSSSFQSMYDLLFSYVQLNPILHHLLHCYKPVCIAAILKNMTYMIL